MMQRLQILALAAGLLAAASLGAVAVGDGAETPPAPAEHPEVDPGETCDGCHRDFTPEVYEAWYAGAHGLNSVKCFVCHGPAGEGFRRRVPAELCRGCHPAQVESLEAPVMAGRSCFACHPPHLLAPHDPHAMSEPGGDP